ncbi:ABC transporter ATP-binding protein [Thermodesulfobacteriota bacterium]
MMKLASISPALKKFLVLAKKFRWLIAGATLCGLLKFNLPLAFPWVFKDIINQLLSPSTAQLDRINQLIFFLVLLFLFWTFITFLRTYLTGQVEQRIIFDLRQEFYSHLQRMSLSFYEKRHVGAIASRLFGDISIAQNLVGGAFTNTIMDLSTLLVITIVLFYMNVKLAFASLVILPVYMYANNYFRGKLKLSSRRAQETMEKITGRTTEKLGGMSVVQSFNHEESETQDFFKVHKKYLRYRLQNVKNNAMATAAIGFLTSIAPVLVVWYGARQVLHGQLTVGELTAFYAYLGMFYQPLNRLTELNIQVANSTAALDRIFEILSITPEITDAPDARSIETVQGDIRFDDVYFAYDPEMPILKNINIHIPAGQTIALVGESGSGKSTLAKLIPRFYDASMGIVSIDGTDVRDVRVKDLRRNIALVSQDPILFSGTILENLLLGRPRATEDEVRNAANQANAHDFIMGMLNGYQTEIGEGGVKLSGGQRQRLALARAFLKDAPVLILDEATSALDSETEQLVQEALQRLVKGRTTIIIAHRFSTIHLAERTFVFHRGQIVETGTRDELLNIQGGYYQKLFNAQCGYGLQAK